jgi:hypothetical protein
MKKNKLLFLISLLIFVFFIWHFFGRYVIIQTSGEATLNWNPQEDESIKGYRIYYGDKPREGDCPPAGYAEKIDVGNKTNYKIKNLPDGKTYYFSVTSYNQSGKESCFSEEMTKTINIKFLDKIKNISFKK